MSTRKLQRYALLLFLVFSLLLGGCGKESSIEDIESLTIGIWGGFWGDAYKAAAIDPFIEETGIQVEIVTNVEDSVALLTTEVGKDTPQYDLLWLTDGEFRIAKNSGLLAPVNYDNIEFADDLYEAGKDEFGVSSEIGAWGIAYNEDLVDEAPTAWADLLDPEIAPMVGFVEPDFSGGSMFNLTILSVAAGGAVEDTATLGIEQGQKLADNGARFGNFGEILTLFSNEEVAYATLYHQEPVYFRQDGMPAQFVSPEEGAFPVTAWMSMPNNLSDKRKAATEKFMSYVLSPEAQLAIAESIFSGPINKTVKLNPELAAKIHPYGQDEVDALFNPDWEYTMENLEDWIDLWNREIQQ